MPNDGSAGPGGEPAASSADDGRSELERLRDRVATLEADKVARAPHHRWRSFFSALLIIIGCVLAPLAAVAAWTADEIGDTDRYVDTVAPLASDPDIQAAAANRVTDAVMEHIDLPTLLEGVAPADRPLAEKALGKLGGALENAVRSFVHDKTEEIVASETFENFWTEANRRIHSAVDKALTGSGGGAVKINNDSVAIDLGPVVDQVKQRLIADGMSAASKIPEVHTDITVLRTDDIGKVKTYFKILQLAGFWLPVLSVLLIAAGVLVSTHRRRVLVVAALAFAFAMLLLAGALTVFREAYLNALPDTVSQPAAESVYDTLTRYMRSTVRMAMTVGVVVALAAWLSGRGRRATFVRQAWHSGIGSVRATADRAGMRTGPVGPFIRRHRKWITWVLVALAVLTSILWSYPTALVIIGIALVWLLVMALVEFLAGNPEEEDARATGAPPAQPTG
ncbi:hypothetical protein ABZ572_17240 [Streptomyces sp. NPDC018338]|uniref:hypothetical protein n=1 Tax=Streptomyces sp. NPDC018338 TaxID=3157192 RepID=UPI0033D21D7A